MAFMCVHLMMITFGQLMFDKREAFTRNVFIVCINNKVNIKEVVKVNFRNDISTILYALYKMITFTHVPL